MLPSLPREIDPARTFDALVAWIHDELIVKKGAPGFVIGLSGTDSILTFLACAKAFEKAGKPGRVVGVHYGEQLPSGEKLAQRLNENPEAFWFQRKVIPWLEEQAPAASILVDSAINYHMDGQRWGALVDWSVIADPKTGELRPDGENYWVVGTRNKSEELLMNYSNASKLASVQPINHLWKSEILKLCDHLNVPDIALAQSCVADCVCGRLEFPALHIADTDALLMVREGQLSPDYVKHNIPAGTRETLEKFIASQINKTRFKKDIPYHPDAATLALSSEVDHEKLALAKQAAHGMGDDVKAISSIVPSIIQGAQANAACDLVCTPSKNRNAWLPEALTLFNTPGLHPEQRKLMLENLFSSTLPPRSDVKGLARCSARLGNCGFSFPKQRHLAQRTEENPSLVEQFGMQRLNRDSDIRDAALPSSDPNRDELGTGFVWNDDTWHVEYRRAYIACSNRSDDAPATVIKRNDSHFFGRDRLPAPVYVSFEKLSPEALQAITADTLENSGRFIKWQDVIQSRPDMPLREKIRRVERAMDYLDDFDRGLNHWLRSSGPIKQPNGAGPDHSASGDQGGFKPLLKFLKQKAAKPAINGRPALFLAEMDGHAPPWFLQSATALTPQLVDQLEKAASGDPLPPPLMRLFNPEKATDAKLVLLTGEHGDFPVVGDKATQVRQARARADLEGRRV